MNLQVTFRENTKMVTFVKRLFPMSWNTRPMIRYLKRNMNNRPLIGVEIGVDLGFNARNMLDQLNLKLLYLIDPYPSYDNIKGSERYRMSLSRLKSYDDKVIWKIMTSHEAKDRVPNNLDFVYVDGDHDYNAVKQDIDDWYPKVKTGGIFGGHNFHAYSLGVVTAVVEFVKENNLELNGADTDWWIIKKRLNG
jgi:hypothetical protein